MPSLSTFWKTKAAETEAQKAIFQIPQKSQTTMGLLPLLLSSDNRQGFNIDFFDQGGKRKIVKYQYMQRAIESEVNSTASGLNYCEPANTLVYLEGQKEATLYRDYKFTIPFQASRDNNNSLDKYFNDGMISAVNALITVINKDIIAAYETARGNTSAGTTTPITSNGFTSFANRQINRAFVDDVMIEFEDIEYNGMLMMAGGGKVRSYANTIQDGGLNDLGQYVDNRLLDGRFMYKPDSVLDTVIGTPDNALIWAQGAAQFLEFFENRGQYRVIKDQIVKDVVIVQFADFNIAFDITIAENYCDKDGAGWVVTLEKSYDFWTYENDVFKVGDPMRGVNWLERFVMT